MKLLNRVVDRLKQNKRYVFLGRALLLMLLPLICCLIATAVEGEAVGRVYLPSSEWNDELFYYKQVESIIRFRYPLGYYGFNESHGLRLSFAAWSPVLILPWIVWGLLFGWNFLSPILCNILLMMAAMFLFGLLVRPTWKQTGVLVFLFCLYTPFVRYMLSGMPEIICISHLIVFYGLAVSFVRKESGWKLAAMFGISGLLTLMRPYMLLFLLLPDVLLVRTYRKAGRGKCLAACLGAAGITGAVLTVYAMIKHFFGAEYFHPLFFTDWITTFFTDGLGAGIHNFFGTLYWKGKGFYAHTVEGVRSGLASGAFFAGYLLTLAVLLWQSAADLFRYRKKAKEASAAEDKNFTAQFIVQLHLTFSFVGMFFALLLMYKLTEGSKHLLTFMGVAVFVIAMMDTRFYKKAVFVGAVFAYLYTYKAVDPYDYQIPYRTREREAQVEEWRGRFAQTMELTTESVPNFENSCIWVFDETSDRGEPMKWQLLYALPEGFGVSCCQKDYVLANLEEINSRYLAAAVGAGVDESCKAHGWTELSRDEDIVLYAR